MGRMLMAVGFDIFEIDLNLKRKRNKNFQKTDWVGMILDVPEKRMGVGIKRHN